MKHNPNRTWNLTILIGIMLFSSIILLFLFSLSGRLFLSPEVIIQGPWRGESLTLLTPDARVFWGERFPKTLLAMLAGSGLALAGLILQTVFRNPLATPFTLGIASGASFGAVICMHLFPVLSIQTFILFGFSPLVLFAFGGAILAMILVYLLGGRNTAGGAQMLLAGIAVSYFFSSLILCFQYISDPSRTFQMLRWTMGGIDNCTARQLIILALLALFIMFYMLFQARELDILLLGDERALALGVNVRRFYYILYIISSCLVGVIVSLCGPIGFVGLMVPHWSRLLMGTEHRYLIPVTFFGGAFFLAFCHTVSRIVIYPAILPVGVITSLLGGPFFLFLLLYRKDGGSLS